jgi:hypothetical protein
MIKNQSLYHVEIEFSAKEGVILNNGGSPLYNEDYLTHIYVRSDSITAAKIKFIQHLSSIALTYKFIGKVRIISPTSISGMDALTIKKRGEENDLSNGNVVLGWLI